MGYFITASKLRLQIYIEGNDAAVSTYSLNKYLLSTDCVKGGATSYREMKKTRSLPLCRPAETHRNKNTCNGRAARR